MNVLLSPAKINIGLWVVGKRADGYHDIFTFMHTVEFYDKIYIKPSFKTTIKTSLSDIDIEDENNIVYKTLVEFENFTGFSENFDIFIEKNIPLGAGLGGGSSNAATVLKFLNEYFSYPLSKDEILRLASSIGADVPFFLEGGFALAEGIGDKITPIENKEKVEIFIIYPNVNSQTKLIYSKVREELLTKKEELNIIYNLQREYGIRELLRVAKNTLGDIARSIYPQMDEVFRFLESLGYKPHVSGSGSSIYCVGEPSEKVELACKIRGWKLIKTKLL